MQNSQKEKPLNKQQLVVSSGYSVMSADSSAHLILEKKGVKDELEKLGFTEANAKNVVSKILLNDDEQSKDRLKAAEMVFKVHGSFAPEQAPQTTNVQNIFFDANIQLATKAYEENLKKLLSNEIPESIQEEGRE